MPEESSAMDSRVQGGNLNAKKWARHAAGYLSLILSGQLPKSEKDPKSWDDVQPKPITTMDDVLFDLGLFDVSAFIIIMNKFNGTDFYFSII